jgi:3',5'-cyclic AMP phosphodiesterase CpdA
MKILHFSDSHAGGAPDNWTAYFDKRLVGIFNYKFRRKFQHNQRLLRKAVEYILSSDADLIVCTGDITSTGQPDEFKTALETLYPIIGKKNLIYVPGNHDFYVYNSRCVDALMQSFRMLNGNRFSLSDLPLNIRFLDCDFIMLNESYPTNLLSSCGYVLRKDSEKILRILSKKRKNPVFLIGHYPLIEKHPLLRVRHRLWREKELLNLLKGGMIDISLCGHVHVPYFMETLPGGRGEYCAGSVTKNANISEIIFNESANSFTHKNIRLIEPQNLG